MRLQHLVRYLSDQAWALEPHVLALGQQILREAITEGRLFTGADLHAELGIPMAADVEAASQGHAKEAKRVGIAVIPIVGIIEPRAGSLGTSAEGVDAMLTQALASREVDGIIFDVASPGGQVTGIPELADRIAAASKEKPMMAFTGDMMASAAYWLGAAAGEVMAAPTALVGSIGVFTLHEDWTEKLKNEGVEITEISAGRFKTEAVKYKPLSEAAEAHMRAMVDEVYGWMVEGIATYRNDQPANVRNGYGEGRVLMAKQAKAANLIDRVGTFRDAMDRMTARVRPRARRGARANVERERLALDSA